MVRVRWCSRRSYKESSSGAGTVSCNAHIRLNLLQLPAVVLKTCTTEKVGEMCSCANHPVISVNVKFVITRLSNPSKSEGS